MYLHQHNQITDFKTNPHSESWSGFFIIQMPNQAKRSCPKAGCNILIGYGQRYCEAHNKQRHAQINERRQNSNSSGYTHEWRQARVEYLRKHPLCVECQKIGRTTAAKIVDHIIPHRGNKTLFWDESNWQSLCSSHHSIKTAREDGGFGNVVKKQQNQKVN